MATMRAIAAWFNFRRRVVAFALVGWVVVVVVGAGRAPDSDEWIVVPDLGAGLLAVFGLFALTGLAMLVYFRPKHGAGFRPRPKQSLRAWILVGIVVVLIAIAFGPREFPEVEASAEPEPVLIAEQGDIAAGEGEGGGTGGSGIAALLLVFVIVGAVLLRSRHRLIRITTGFADQSTELLDEDLASAIDEAIHQLQSATEPRMAVLAAYASLERALAERGRPRHPAETPTEHLARVLAAFPMVASPAVRLGRLYEVARFSDHPITNNDRNRAGEALVRARRALVTLADDPR